MAHGRFASSTNGTVHFLEVGKTGEGASAGQGQGANGKDPPVDLYRMDDRVAIRHLDGHWAKLGIADFDPEESSAPGEMSISLFSKKLISALGGPEMRNQRAEVAVNAVRIRDPRPLLQRAIAATQSDATIIQNDQTRPVTIGVDVPVADVKDFLGRAMKIDAMKIDVKFKSPERVTEVREFVRIHGNKSSDLEKSTYWNIEIVYSSIASEKETVVPPEVEEALK